MYTFTYNGSEYVNFDLDDQEVVDQLIKKGVPEDIINKAKTVTEIPTTEERLKALEDAMLANLEL